jgi:hypothetical protein
MVRPRQTRVGFLRRNRWVDTRRMPCEEAEPASDQQPALHDAPENRGLDLVRNPSLMSHVTEDLDLVR